MESAKEQMLSGREPANQRDWQLIVNFFAFNTDPTCAEMAVPFLCRLYDIPLTEGQVKEIVAFQLANRP